jgi:cell division protein FtsB
MTLNLVLDGSLFRLWSLHRDEIAIEHDIRDLKQQNVELKKRLAGAKDPAFLEREARDRFDLVSKGDLVFVFSEEGAANQ